MRDVDCMHQWLNRVMGVLKNVLEALHRCKIAFRGGLFVVRPELLEALDSFWDPLECGGLSVAQGTLVAFLRHPPIIVQSPGQ
jgi:hypothetical protein